MLMEDTLRICVQYLTAVRREEYEENRAQTFQSLVLQGKLQTTVRWITKRDTGGILQPAERCKKTGERVMEVLRTKHPEARPPTAASLDSYPDLPPELALVDITDDTVTAVAGRISGEAEPGGKDSLRIQNWMLHFREASGELWLIVADFTEWLSNGRPPWSAYRSMMGSDRSELKKLG